MTRHSARPSEGNGQQKPRLDRWSAMALSLDPNSHASTPSALAMRFTAGAMQVSEIVSTFSLWGSEQRKEFAGALDGADPVQKHRLAMALSTSGAASPELLSSLSFKPKAEQIAMEYAVGADGQTPNRIVSDLSARYPDASLKELLSAAFTDASELCEDASRRKLLLRVSRLLKNGAGGCQAVQ